jgi:class 3 adenylate cyclase
LDELPSGTVTLLFSDIEGSTQLVHRLGEAYGAALLAHRRLIRDAVVANGGTEVDCRADEFFAAFARARDAVAAAVAVQHALAGHAWTEGVSISVRLGLHAGEPQVEGGAYLGLDVNRAARICAAGHGGQILLSQTVRDLVEGRAEIKDLGSHKLAGLPRSERIYQLISPDLPADFPPLRVQADAPRRSSRRLRLRAREPTLADAAWQARELLPQLEPSLRTPVTQLGASIFAADRAAVGADAFLARVDREHLARRLATQRVMAVSSERAEKQSQALEAQVASVDHLLERRRVLAGYASELPVRLEPSITNATAIVLRERVEAATGELDAAVTDAASMLDPLSFRLRRTRYRGVYRSGSRYVVPFVDELGADRRREFDTVAQARDFRAAVHIVGTTQIGYTGPRFPPDAPL